MIGSVGGAVLLWIAVAACCVAGAVTGFVACIALRRSWNVNVGLFDLALAAVATTATAFVYAAIAVARHGSGPALVWTLLAAVVSVALRHSIRAYRAAR